MALAVATGKPVSVIDLAAQQMERRSSHAEACDSLDGGGCNCTALNLRHFRLPILL
jgi:hypothetical protein